MALLGRAALAMWWDMAAEWRVEFEHWHTHEHFPERLGVPGFLRASRWRSADGGEGFFILYELAGHEVLSSPQYLERLNAPSPWSTRLMPHHRNMVRTQCHVLESTGPAIASHMLTVRLAPRTGQDEGLRRAIAAQARAVAGTPGLAGVHLLRHETPAIATTHEQKLRGESDRDADWILLAGGYDAGALSGLAEGVLGAAALGAQGAAPGAMHAQFSLSCSATASDVG